MSDKVICPYCNYIDKRRSFYDDLDLHEDYAETTKECYSCGETYTVQLRIQYSYIVRK